VKMILHRLSKNVWKDPKFLQELGLQRRLVWKLKCLKIDIKSWAFWNRSQTSRRLEQLESDLQKLYQTSLTDLNNQEMVGQVNSLELERFKILQAEEDLWRQQSRAIWLKSGDQNTKFFHHYASDRKNRKQIWEIQDETCQEISGQEDLKSEAVKFFKNFGLDLGILREDQTMLASQFPHMVTEEDSILLERICTKEELWNILKDFAKDKSPGPDGWTVEFFLHFFELVGEDLLGMVEESRRKGEVIKALNSTFLVLIPKVNKPLTFW
jgi:hypothetical protein